MVSRLRDAQQRGFDAVAKRVALVVVVDDQPRR
jgi:hypothetical protein